MKQFRMGSSLLLATILLTWMNLPAYGEESRSLVENGSLTVSLQPHQRRGWPTELVPEAGLEPAQACA
jgi:hypothetical protein